MREFFGGWRDALPQARKWAVACRDYVMTKLAYLSRVRAAELCGVGMADVHWEAGQWGRFVGQGKGARGSGPREAFHVRAGTRAFVVVHRGRARPVPRRSRTPAGAPVPFRAAALDGRGSEHADRAGDRARHVLLRAEGGRAPVSAGAGHQPVPASAAPRVRDPPLRARHESVGGPAAAGRATATRRTCRSSSTPTAASSWPSVLPCPAAAATAGPSPSQVSTSPAEASR